MRVLVTGHQGKIGQELVKLMGEHDLLLVDKRGLDKCNLSFNDLGFIKDFEPEVVIHLAASFERTDESPLFHSINHEDNIVASYRLNQVLATCPAPKQYIFASSYLVYDPYLYLADAPLKEPYMISEVAETSPRNLIGAAKLYVEKEIDYLRRNIHPSMKVAHARIFRVFGDGGQEFVSRLIQMKKIGLPADIWKPENRFDYISAADCASALKSIMDNELDRVVNVGTGEATSIADIIDAVKPNVRIIEKNDQFEASVADITELTELTGWSPKDNVIDWCKKRIA